MSSDYDNMEAIDEEDHPYEEHTQPIYQPLAPEVIGLPEGWHRYFDEEYQSFYYYNEVDDSSQWHHPQSSEDPYMLYEDENIIENISISQKVAKLNLNEKKVTSSHIYESFDQYAEYDDDHYVQYSDYNINSKVNLYARSVDEERSKRNKDYVALARTYKFQRPYSDPNYKAICLLCHEDEATDVFFPCQHRCVCHNCIVTENICDESKFLVDPDSYCMCSLCAEIIKKILPFEHGLEVEKYWDWVYEEKVVLPREFMRNFKHSEAIITSVYMNDKHRAERKAQQGTSTCSIS